MRLPISFLSQANPQKSDRAPKTVAAKMELVPNPEPAGMAANRVTSNPQPKALSCASNEGKRSAANSGKKPANAKAAFGMEKGEPTLLYRRNSSQVWMTSIAPKSMERRMICGVREGFT